METIFTSEEPVVSVDFVHNDWSCDTLAVVTDSQVIVCQLVLEPEVTCTVVKRYLLPCRPIRFVWSPDTCIESSPQVIKFAVCAFDKSLTVTMDCGERSGSVSRAVLEGDRLLNDAAFNPHRDGEMAVVGDEGLCRFFDADGQQTRPALTLPGPGRRVAWRRDRADLVLVAEETGSVRLFNAASGRLLQLLDLSSYGGLLDADWLPAEMGSVWTAALLPGQVLLADMAAPSATRILFPTPSDVPGAAPHCCRWCPSNRGLLAVSGAAAPTCVLHHKLSTFLNAGPDSSGSRAISWHLHRNLLAMARHYSVHLWAVDAL